MKQIKHTFGGTEFTLDFGVMYYLKFAGEFFKGAPLALTAEAMSDPAKQFQFCTALVFAGVNAFNKVNKLPLVTVEDAEDMIGTMTESDCADLIKKYQDVQFPAEAGEDTAQQ